MGLTIVRKQWLQSEHINIQATENNNLYHATSVTNDIQHFLNCCLTSPVHLDLRPDNISFARLQHVSVSGTLVLFKHIPISYILIWLTFWATDFNARINISHMGWGIEHTIFSRIY